MERCPFWSIRFCFRALQVQECVVRNHGTVFDAGIPAETLDLSYRKRAVCGDWMVGAPALEPETRRPPCATRGHSLKVSRTRQNTACTATRIDIDSESRMRRKRCCV